MSPTPCGLRSASDLAATRGATWTSAFAASAHSSSRPASSSPRWPPHRPGRTAHHHRAPIGLATSCRRATTAAFPPPRSRVDQLPLYDGLTPLRGNVTDADIDSHYLPEDFKPVGATHEEPTGRPGTTILYDAYGVPHVTGKTRADLAFGAGWVTARDRGLLLQLGRGPARAAVADIPGINAFGLVTSGQSFVPSAATEQILTDQVDLIVKTYGDKGRQIIADLQAKADGITAYFQAHGIDQPPATVNDVIAVTAFIGSIFGAGGGAEASNAEFLSKLQNHLGTDTGRKAWEDAMLFDDPEAPTTITRTFDYGPLTGGKVTGSVGIDEGSIVSFDPTAAPAPATAARSASLTAATASAGDSPTYPAAGPVPSKQASNFLIVDPTRSATSNEPGRDGSAARVLLPGDRRSRSISAVRASRPRASRFRAPRCTSSSAGPRTTRGA